MKSLVLTGCCLVALALFVPAILGGCETKQARYETVTEARSAGLFSRGWAPDVLPKGAGPVIEAHDLDTNARCFRAALQPDSAGGRPVCALACRLCLWRRSCHLAGAGRVLPIFAV